ncbi:putative high osmolarity signaling protein [Vairimorpha necatrix]|uniref:High osmolarity signaling protein n=1 Tax=Vairimorpha necatrix TaxID=6039 RepID=A0AAX4JE43_9MICR
MNWFSTTLIKSLLCLGLHTCLFYFSPSYFSFYLILSLLLLNIFFISFIKYKSDIFRSRFLRKQYRPSCTLLVTVYSLELSITTIFYYYNTNIICIILNYSILGISYIYRNSRGRKTSPLERNEEFFKIAFLTENYEVNDKIIKKGEVVQIVDKKGENVLIRNSTGQKYIIPSKIVNDDIDLIL